MTTSMDGCVMLALSTFRKSGLAVQAAIEKAKSTKKLFVVFVADVNLARYFIGSELSPGMREMCEADILKLHEQEGLDKVKEIAEKACLEGLEMDSFIGIGRFGLVCLDLVEKLKPSVIVTTRSNRPEWVKKIFGAPVSELVDKAGCPVMVV